MTEKITTTNNTIVDTIGKMNITGNVIPEAWYKTIQKTRNHPYLNAIILLSEIVYWYRPAEVCDEETGSRTFKKKFKEDFWQISMTKLSEKFGLSKDQVRDALDFLESSIKVIKRHYRDIYSRAGRLSNVLYIELIPSVLMNLTYPDSEDSEIIPGGSGNFSNTYLEKFDEVVEKTPTPIGKNSNTYTKNTIENNKENTDKTTTTEDAVVCCCDNSLFSYIKEKFNKYNLTDKDINLIYNATTKGTEDIDRAYEYIIHYNRAINNIVPFIISAIKNGWTVQKAIEPANTEHKNIHGFSSREYDWDELEKELFGKN